MLPDRQLRVQFILVCAVAGAFILAVVQAGLVFWRLVDGWLGPF